MSVFFEANDVGEPEETASHFINGALERKSGSGDAQ